MDRAAGVGSRGRHTVGSRIEGVIGSASRRVIPPGPGGLSPLDEKSRQERIPGIPFLPMTVTGGHKGRVFYSYLLSFLLISLIPVSMTVFVFRKANEVVTEDAKRATDLLLEQTVAYLDMVMDDVRQLSYLVSYNIRLETLLYEELPLTGDELYRAYQLVQDFFSYRVSSTGTVDFYVYLPNLDMVISPDGYSSTLNYQMIRRQSLGEDHHEWLSGLEAVRRRMFRPGREVMVPLYDRIVGSVELITPLPAGAPTRQPKAGLVASIDENRLSHPFQDSAWSAEGALLVYHREFGLISTSNPEINAEVLRERGIAPDTVSRLTQIDLAGTSYLVTVLDSSVENWSYVSLIPGDFYTSQFSGLRQFTLAAFVLCTVLGAILIYWIASVRYRPIQSLLAMLEPEADGSISLRSDEFQIIRSSLQATLAHDRLLQQQVSENQPLMLQRYMQQLLKGVAEETDDTDRRLARLDANLASSWLALALVEVDLENRSQYPTVVSYLEDLVSQETDANFMVIRDLDGTIGIVRSSTGRDLEGLIVLLGYAKRKIEVMFAVSCAVGVSEAHTRQNGFPVLLQEARAALSYRLVRGGAQPIRFAEVLTAGRTYHYPIAEETRLINSITAGSYPAASGMVDEIFSVNFDRVQLSVEMARCLMFDLISTMIKTLNAIPSVGEDAPFWSDVKPITRLTQCQSLEELKSEIDRILRLVCDHVRSGRTSHTEQLRTEIISFIETNLYDRNLGTEMVATHLNRNSDYIARFFREEMGTGVSQHIKKLRVAIAKKRLAGTDATVRAVAVEVGFVDSNALIRAVKQIEGVTPGEYRDSSETA
ncbi:MAG: AraC family transcriptional regulator [Spirochaetales bacterium]|nr:MAG: AraC family transcriptional regulator [Spirochaetales bacterium]